MASIIAAPITGKHLLNLTLSYLKGPDLKTYPCALPLNISIPFHNIPFQPVTFSSKLYRRQVKRQKEACDGNALSSLQASFQDYSPPPTPAPRLTSLVSFTSHLPGFPLVDQEVSVSSSGHSPGLVTDFSLPETAMSKSCVYIRITWELLKS